MGFVKKTVKKVAKGVGKVVKGVAKGIKGVAKGIAKAAKGIGKAISKMGPIASIGMQFMLPGLGGVLSTALGNPLLGAMAKGAITGFVGSGGDLKGALLGGLAGGALHGAGAVFEGAKAGWTASEGGLTDKITGAFKGASATVEEGFSNLYQSADKFISGGGDVNAPTAGTDVMKNVHAQNIDIEKDYYFEESSYSKLDQDAIVDYAKQTQTGLPQAEELWKQTGGSDVEMSFDYQEISPDTYEYTGEGLKATVEASQYPMSAIPTQEVKKDKMNPFKASAPASLLKPSWEAPTPMPIPEMPKAEGGLSTQTGYGSSMTASQAWNIVSNPSSFTPEEYAQAQQMVAKHQQTQQLQRSFG